MVDCLLMTCYLTDYVQRTKLIQNDEKHQFARRPHVFQHNTYLENSEAIPGKRQNHLKYLPQGKPPWYSQKTSSHQLKTD